MLSGSALVALLSVVRTCQYSLQCISNLHSSYCSRWSSQVFVQSIWTDRGSYHTAATQRAAAPARAKAIIQAE